MLVCVAFYGVWIVIKGKGIEQASEIDISNYS